MFYEVPQKVSKKAADVWCRHLKSPLVDWITINSLLHPLFFISKDQQYIFLTLFSGVNHILFFTPRSVSHINNYATPWYTAKGNPNRLYFHFLRIGKGVPSSDTKMKWNILCSNKRQKQELKKMVLNMRKIGRHSMKHEVILSYLLVCWKLLLRYFCWIFR